MEYFRKIKLVTSLCHAILEGGGGGVREHWWKGKGCVAEIFQLKMMTIGPLQLAIHVVQNRRAGEQKSHRDKTNKENYHFKIMYVFCLSCPSATFALQRGSFVPREELAAKGLLFDKYIYLSSIPLVRSSYSLKPEKSMIITVYTSQRIKPLHRVVGSLMNPHCGGLVKVARLDFFSGIPPKFEP